MARAAAAKLAYEKEEASKIKAELEVAAREANEQLKLLRQAQNDQLKQRQIKKATEKMQKALLGRLKAEIKAEADKLALLKTQ